MKIALVVGAMLLAGSLWAQAGQELPAGGTTQSPNPANTNPAKASSVPEMSTREETVTFRAKVNLVLVRVVVRDSKGKPVGNLRAEDFQVFDTGKPQNVKLFEPLVAKDTRLQTTTETGRGTVEAPAKTESNAEPSVPPRRFVAFVFDDVHLRFGDLEQTRAALLRKLSLQQATDRIALYTTSGNHNVEFTDDPAKVREELTRIRPFVSNDYFDTPPPSLTYYAADQIRNKEHETLLMPFTRAALAQLNIDPTKSDEADTRSALQRVMRAAELALERGDRESGMTLALLKDAVRRLSEVPGERNIILVSSGFYTRRGDELNRIIDQAVRAHITVNSLSARGVEVLTATGAGGVGGGRRVGPRGEISAPTRIEALPLPDISNSHIPETQLPGNQAAANAAAVAQSLQDLAGGTGGIFLGTNDFDGFFQRATEPPEYSYMLGFTPNNLKADGSYHPLQVRLRQKGLSVQSRRGYFVPSRPANPAEAARQEVEAAMFSEDEIRDIPVSVSTQYFKSADYAAVLSVVTHIDIGKLPLRRVEDRNNDDLALFAAVFDRNGNYVAGKGQMIEMRLRDETLSRLAQGIDIRTSLAVQSGNYLLRVVVRDSEGALISAVNQAVQID